MKDCLFFKKLCFQQLPWSWRNNLRFSTVIVRPTSGLIETVTSGFSNSNIREKTGQKLFLTGKLAFFSKKFCFQQPLRSWRNDLITPIVIVRLVLDPQKPSPEVCQARIYEKKPVKIFSLLENCPFFFKKMCFQQPLMSWRNDLSFSTVIVKLASGLIEFVTWVLSNSNIREKNWPKTFPHWITCLVSTTSKVLKKWCYSFQVIVKKPCAQL